MAIETLVHNLGYDQVVHIRYGVWPSDPYYGNNPENVVRPGYYGIGTSTPQAMVDGLYHSLGSGQISSQVPVQVNNRLGVSSPYEISISGDPATDSVWVKVKATAAPSSGPKMLRVAVIEKAYDWPTAPGSNGQTHYEHCLLDFVPNPTGTSLNIAVGDSQRFGFTYNAQQVNYHPSLHLTVVAFVQNDNSKEVLQAGFFDGSVSLEATKGSALFDTSETAVLSGQIKNDFPSTTDVNFRIKGQIPAGWDVTVTSPQGNIPLNSLQQLTVAGSDSLPFDIEVDPQGIGGSMQLKAKLMSVADSSAYQEVVFNAVTKGVDILVVDDDGGQNYESYLLNALATTSYSYGTIPIESGDLSASDLSGIPAIMWFSSNHAPALNQADMDALSAYLDAGGNLFLTGYNIAYELGDPNSPYYSTASEDFLHNYLHSEYLAENVFILNVNGVAGDPISDGLTGMKLFAGSGANNMGYVNGQYIYPDQIAPYDTNATAIFSFYNQPNKKAAIRAFHGPSRIVFMPFCYEATADQTYREALATNIADWFAANTGILSTRDPVARKFRLFQNYPNPFNPTTHIRYALNNFSPVRTRILVYNSLGQVVRTLVDEMQTAGSYQVTWDGKDGRGRDVASGIYYYRLVSGDQTATQKMILIR